MDPRNRPALVGALVAGVAAFLVLWVLGLSVVAAWLVGWAIPAFALYGIDKRQAQVGGWRVPEAVLHGLALIGGVIGAWAGRAVFRHKTQKPSLPRRPGGREHPLGGHRGLVGAGVGHPSVERPAGTASGPARAYDRSHAIDVPRPRLPAPGVPA